MWDPRKLDEERITINQERCSWDSPPLEVSRDVLFWEGRVKLEELIGNGVFILSTNLIYLKYPTITSNWNFGISGEFPIHPLNEKVHYNRMHAQNDGHKLRLVDQSMVRNGYHRLALRINNWEFFSLRLCMGIRHPNNRVSTLHSVLLKDQEDPLGTP